MMKEQIKILIAPNSMKGSMSAFEFADTVEEAFLKVSDQFSIRKVPVADGGDFTGEVLQAALKAHTVNVKVKDPLGREISSKIAVAGKTAIIEMADASGIKLLKQDEPDPMKASSFGTGQLIAAAIEQGCTELLLGVGGSATVDGGSGMMQALGFSYYDREGRPIDGNGKNLGKIASVKTTKLPKNISIKIISDVDNPLLGDNGAATVFGPQKGATALQVIQLEQGLDSWCRLLEKESGKKLADVTGAGAAGGLAIPLMAWYNAETVPGAAYVLSVLNFEEQVRWADVVITGEGKIDRQTLNNKAPKAVADVARNAGKPVIAVGGIVEPEAAGLFTGGAFSFLNGPVSLEDAMKNAPKHLSFFSAELAKLILFLKK